MGVTEQEVESLQSMTPAEKLRIMHSLIQQAYELTAAGIRSRWPEMSEEEVRARTRAQVAGDEL